MALLYSSPLGLGSLGAGLALSLGLGLGGVPPLLGGAGGLGLVALVFVGSLVTGLGPRQARKAKEALLAREAAAKLHAASAARDKLARIRLPDPEMEKAVSLVVLRAGEYITAYSGTGLWDPESGAALEEALELVDIYCTEADQASVERRFSLPDKDPFPEAKARILAGLESAALALGEGVLRSGRELPAARRMEIREELK
ncbi:MAG TPA: hypothetical protein VIO60_07835 [Rectinemataceae bacterium]